MYQMYIVMYKFTAVIYYKVTVKCSDICEVQIALIAFNFLFYRYKDMIDNLKVDYIAGGATLNSMRVAQVKLVF